ncbi:unnamed protein product [Cuscuta campestris]|uniref:Uncharacterized protein n=1 Tax=Cuscuta campestris TaxID=132261 RepID=A0A484KAC2_9ASTE|nr:unnamed protein product [Cuscuta campestris]
MTVCSHPHMGRYYLEFQRSSYDFFVFTAYGESTVYVKLVMGTAIAWSLSHVGLDLTKSWSNGWTTQRQ